MDHEENSTATLIAAPAISKAIRQGSAYLTGQPYGNLLSTVIILGFGYWFWWFTTIGQPKQLLEQRQDIIQTTVTLTKQFSESTQSQTAVTSEALKASSEQHAKAVQSIVDEHKDSVKSMLEHSEKAMQRRDADFKDRE